MSQSSITSFFTSRKKRPGDELLSSKRKVLHVNPSETKLLATSPEAGDISFVVSAPVAEKRVKNIASELSSSKTFTSLNKLNQTSNAETLASARKELSLGDIRKKLGGSAKHAEILSRARELNERIKRQTTNVDQAIKSSKSIEHTIFSSPSKTQNTNEDSSSLISKTGISPRKVVVSPVKSPSKVPAYIKYAHLTKSTGLPLPHHYRHLAETFRSMEQVVSLLYNRNERITFSKLKPSVQEMLKRNFTEKLLGQIKYLVPDFYNFEVEKSKTHSQKETHELVITPNFPNDIKVMNSTVLLERQRYFYDSLLQLVKKKHDQFIKTQFPNLSVPSDKLVRWHPDFDLHQLPEIEHSKLPEITNKDQLSTAQEVLMKAREMFKCNTRMEKALNKLAEAKERGLTKEEKEATGCDDKTKNVGTQRNEESTPFLNPHLRNLPASLIERVKAKQAAKALEAMTRSVENEQKYEIFSRLPDLARTLRNIFVTERKNVLALNLILSKLDSSFKGNISAKSLQGDIELLAKHTPNFVNLHNLRNVSYLKLDRNSNLNDVIAELDKLANSYK